MHCKKKKPSLNEPWRKKVLYKEGVGTNREIAQVMAEPPHHPTSLLRCTGNKNSILSDKQASYDLAFRPLTISLFSSSSTLEPVDGTVKDNS